MVYSLSEFNGKPLDGYKGYFAHEDGYIYSLLQSRGREYRRLHNGITSDGYSSVVLCYDGIKRTKKVHPLIGKTFLGDKTKQGLQLRHLNGIRTDNRLSNLSWGTAKENAEDRKLHGTNPEGSKIGNSKLNEEIVKEIKRLYFEEKKFARQIAELFSDIGICEGTIFYVTSGRGWKHVK